MKKNSSHKTLSIVKRISITNIGIFIIACILSIVATLKLNVEYHIDRDAQMMKVYISNTLSSIDNTLKDMGRVSLIAFSDQTVQDILKGTDYSFDEKMENEEYLKKLYSSMISIRDDVRGIYIFNNEDMVFYSDTWNPFLGFDWNVESFFQDVKINSDLSTNISGCHMYVGTLPEAEKIKIAGIEVGCASKDGTNKVWNIAIDNTKQEITITAATTATTDANKVGN